MVNAAARTLAGAAPVTLGNPTKPRSLCRDRVKGDSEGGRPKTYSARGGTGLFHERDGSAWRVHCCSTVRARDRCTCRFPQRRTARWPQRVTAPGEEVPRDAAKDESSARAVARAAGIEVLARKAGARVRRSLPVVAGCSVLVHRVVLSAPPCGIIIR